MYQVLVSDEAQKQFKNLGRDRQRIVGSKIDQLERWPEVSAQPLWGAGHGHYRLKARDLRVIFRVDEPARQVFVETIQHRGKAYGGYHYRKKS